MNRPALVDLEPGLLAVLPLGHGGLAAEHAGVHAHVGQRLGQGERASPDLPILPRLGRHAGAHVLVALLRGALLVDGSQGQVGGQGTGGRARVDPGKLEGDQG